MKLGLATVAFALLAAACGSNAATVGTSQAPPASARLIVAEPGKEPCCYTEGYVRFLRIESDGHTVFDGRWDDGGAFVRPMPAGTYRVTRYLRPCDGNCGYLDPPSERCSLQVRIDGPADVRITALPQNLGSCRLVA